MAPENDSDRAGADGHVREADLRPVETDGVLSTLLPAVRTPSSDRRMPGPGHEGEGPGADPAPC
jgi:hypothetical protein